MTYSPNFRGNTGNASSRQLTTTYQNASGSTIAKTIPVSANASGQIAPLDVTDETSALSMVGISAESIPNTATGQVTSGGRLEAVTTTFAVGDAIYVGLGGTLTNVKPDLDVVGWEAGYFVIFVGIVVKNQFNPALKDIQLLIEKVGQL